MKTVYRVSVLLFSLAMALTWNGAIAQDYPTRVIRLIVGFGPGGGTDILGRIVAQGLTERLNVPVTVENKPGANSNIGTDYVAKSSPDGYTLCVCASASMVHSAGLYDRLPFDPLKDFAPIAMIVSGDTIVFAVNSSLPIHSINDLIAYAKARPGNVFFSSGAAPFQVAGEYLNKLAGMKITHVPFKGSAGAVTAAVSGQTQMVVVSVAAGLGQFKSGKLRPLAVTGFKRDHVLSDLPTMKEVGLENFEVPMWTGLFAPVATPPGIIDKLARETAAVLNSDAAKKRLDQLGYEVGHLTPAEFAKQQHEETSKWGKIIRDELHIRLE